MRIPYLIFAVVATLLLAALQAHATIDATLQMQLGNPSGAIVDTNNHDHYLIQRTVESLDYSDNLGEPNWASWDLTAGDVGNSGRSSSFFTDTNLPPNFYRVTPTDYDGVGSISFDRGHMCPSEDRTDNVTDNDMVFFMSNIIPQASNNNEGVWANFESYCRSLASAGNELLITCGPSGFGTTRIPSGKAVIPNYTWKIVVVVPLGSGTALSRITSTNRVIVIKIPNNNSVSSAWQNYITSASQIEVDTGYTFFTALPTDVAAVLRNQVDGQTNPPPVINSFSPTNGAVGDSIVITGTNFTSATAVTFNGVSATFTVNSNTQITATVPPNASSGLISVTASGTAISSSDFIVNGLPVDLVITTSHTGNFTRGDTADTYIISVANVGSLPSSGTITVTDALPAGLIATDMSGDGWTTNLNALSCTRTDALPAGASYPLITVTVAVAPNCPNILTNIVSVSGGGDANAANNTASDLTTVFAPIGSITNTTLIGWDVNGLTGGSGNYGASPLAPTTNAPNLSVVAGLTRGSGISTSGSAAQRAWGGASFTSASETNAITANQGITFVTTAKSGYTVSYTSISRFDYRRSPVGPPTGALQYQVGSGTFTDITALSYPTNTSGGASLNPIDLSSIAALQNVGAGTNVTFRIVNYSGGSGGTWYIFDVAASTALDFAVQGTVSPVVIVTNVPSSSSATFTNQQFQFVVSGTTGVNYIIQASTNLLTPDWISIFTNAAPFTFTDTNTADFGQRYYRVTY
ncbi:MAG TPA: DNA/RNA non-specific endonuclease [Verrucomicrobiae bacterium]